MGFMISHYVAKWSPHLLIASTSTLNNVDDFEAPNGWLDHFKGDNNESTPVLALVSWVN